jgi:DNA-3-methyladenine glycosylase II
MTRHAIKKSLDTLAKGDRDVRRALSKVGYPDPRMRPAGFETLLRIIIGQQVSVAAANAIYGRLFKALKSDVRAERLLRLRETTLKKAGLSGPKVRYARCLARAIQSDELDLDGLEKQSDEEASETLQTVPGLGRWSAEVYLMFSLGRPDLWPHADVGAMRGLQWIRQLEVRPTAREADSLAQAFSPHRSAMALLAWRCANATVLPS